MINFNPVITFCTTHWKEIIVSLVFIFQFMMLKITMSRTGKLLEYLTLFMKNSKSEHESVNDSFMSIARIIENQSKTLQFMIEFGFDNATKERFEWYRENIEIAKKFLKELEEKETEKEKGE